MQSKALGENEKKHTKITVRQQSTTTSRIYNKPRHYEVSSVCDNNSFPRPYRDDAHNVLRVFFEQLF